MAVLESNARGEAPTNEDRTRRRRRRESSIRLYHAILRLHGAVLHTVFGQSVAVPPSVVTIELADDEEEEDCKEDGGEDVVAIPARAVPQSHCGWVCGTSPFALPSDAF